MSDVAKLDEYQWDNGPEAEPLNWRRIAGDLAHAIRHIAKEHDLGHCSNWQDPLERWKLAERHSPTERKFNTREEVAKELRVEADLATHVVLSRRLRKLAEMLELDFQ